MESKPTGFDSDWNVRCYGWMRELTERAAAADGRTLSDFVRTVLVDVSRRRVARAEADR